MSLLQVRQATASSRTRSRSSVSRTAGGALLASALVWLAGGCVVFVEDVKPADVTFVVRDKATGNDLSDCLLLGVHSKSKVGIAGIRVTGCSPSWAGLQRAVEAKLQRVDSPYQLHQQAIHRADIYLGLLYVTAYHGYGYEVMRLGHLPKGVSSHEVYQSAESGKHLVVILCPEAPGTFESNNTVVSFCEFTLERYLSAVREDDPLRDELLELLEKQLQRVLDWPAPDEGLYPGPLHLRAGRCLEEIGRLRGGGKWKKWERGQWIRETKAPGGWKWADSDS